MIQRCNEPFNSTFTSINWHCWCWFMSSTVQFSGGPAKVAVKLTGFQQGGNRADNAPYFTNNEAASFLDPACTAKLLKGFFWSQTLFFSRKHQYFILSGFLLSHSDKNSPIPVETTQTSCFSVTTGPPVGWGNQHGYYCCHTFKWYVHIDYFFFSFWSLLFCSGSIGETRKDELFYIKYHFLADHGQRQFTWDKAVSVWAAEILVTQNVICGQPLRKESRYPKPPMCR